MPPVVLVVLALLRCLLTVVQLECRADLVVELLLVPLLVVLLLAAPRLRKSIKTKEYQQTYIHKQ